MVDWAGSRSAGHRSPSPLVSCFVRHLNSMGFLWQDKIVPSLAAPVPALMEAALWAGPLMKLGLFTVGEDGNKLRNLLALFPQG